MLVELKASDGRRNRRTATTGERRYQAHAHGASGGSAVPRELVETPAADLLFAFEVEAGSGVCEFTPVALDGRLEGYSEEGYTHLVRTSWEPTRRQLRAWYGPPLTTPELRALFAGWVGDVQA